MMNKMLMALFVAFGLAVGPVSYAADEQQSGASTEKKTAGENKDKKSGEEGKKKDDKKGGEGGAEPDCN